MKPYETLTFQDSNSAEDTMAKRGLMPAKSLPLGLGKPWDRDFFEASSSSQDDNLSYRNEHDLRAERFREMMSRAISANLEVRKMNMMGEKMSLSFEDIVQLQQVMILKLFP